MSTFERMLNVLGDRFGNETNLVAKLLRLSDQPRRNRARRSKAMNRFAVDSRAERLEDRLAMAIEIFSPAVDQGFATWAVITSDNADDVYVQQVATDPQDLWVADNASFNDYQSFGGFHTGSLTDDHYFNGINTETTIYVTNGTAVSATMEATEVGDGSQSTFVLARGVAERSLESGLGVVGDVEGVVSHAGNTWTFTNNGSGNRLLFTPASSGGLSDPNLIQPLTGQVVALPAGSGTTSGIRIDWSAPALAIAARGAPSINSVRYLISTGPDQFNNEFSLAKSSGTTPTVQLPVTPVNPGGIVPGTLGGSLIVDGYPVAFRINNLLGGNKLLFEKEGGTPNLVGEVIINQGTPNQKTVNVTADVGLDSGVISLEFTEGGKPIDPGAVRLIARYAVYNQDALPNSFVLAPGLTFEKELYVDLLTPGSQISLDSPITQNIVNSVLSLRATNIDLNARIDVKSFLDIGSAGVTLDPVDRKAIGAAANAYAVVSGGGVSAIGIPSGQGGQGYLDLDPITKQPNPINVSITGGGGSGATAVAYSRNGVIYRVQVTAAGSGYTSIPTVTVPTPAKAYAIVDNSNNSDGGISAIYVPFGQGGQGYNDAFPIDVTISEGGGSGASAVAYSTGGVITSIVVTSPGTGYTSTPTVTIESPNLADPGLQARLKDQPAAFAEQVNFNAQVTAPTYDIRVSDDPTTSAVNRGRMFVSSTGSLTAAAATNTGVVAAAGSLYVQADTSDVYVEGTINATLQSYLFRSPNAAEPLAPFVFTTASPRTGVNTGLIQGKTVAITLGNDLNTVEQQSAASNTIALQTRIDSLRVRAATRKGDPISGPFPYDMTISEQGDISFDAIAASGRSISLSASGNIGLTAAMATWGDLSITAGKNFDVTAPVSAVRGKISIAANTLKVTNSVRVLDAMVDDRRDDITLTATAGDLSLTGAVAAVNNVRLVQRNKAGRAGNISGPSRIIANGIDVEAEGSAILKTDAVTLSGRAAGDFAVDELNDIHITSLRAPGLVSLRAGGADPGTNDRESPLYEQYPRSSVPLSPNVIALKATLYDVVSLEASAPRGSIDIVSDTAKTLVLGNGPTQTLAGPVVVTDAAVNVIGRILVVARTTTDDLYSDNGDVRASSYSQGVTGKWGSTLAGNYTTSGGVFRPLTIGGVAVATGDRVLLANQKNVRENGVYLVTFSGSADRDWVLTRAPEAEVPATLAQGLSVLVGSASSTYGGRSFIVKYDRDAARATSNMQAAGTVSIRSAAGPVIVADAPIGGGSAIPVRVATSSNLAATYVHGAPGRVAGTLTGGSNTALQVGTMSLRVGDRILVANQDNANENGVYAVTVSGSMGRPWVLTRALEADTSAELSEGTYVREVEGPNAGSVYVMNYSPAYGSSPLTVSAVANRAGAETVRVATTTTLPGSYDATAGEISGSGVMPTIDGITLLEGDRVLVRLGTQDALPGGTGVTPLPVSVANGVYEVVSDGDPDAGSDETTSWLLRRASNIDTLDPIETGYVITTEGSYRAIATGQAFAVAHDSLGIDLLTAAPFTAATDIGTNDSNDLTTLVVSSTAGTNDANGSLGKMITLRQALAASQLPPPNSPKIDFAFSSVLPGTNGGAAGVVRLTQELPAISKAFAINGANQVRLPQETGVAASRIAIDGSRITATRTGQPAAASEVNGIEFIAGAGSMPGFGGGSVANLTIGGFATGSAVKINGVGGIQVNKVVLGRSETGDRLINQYGVRAVGFKAEGTVSGSTIVGSTQAGICVESGATGLKIVGTTVGALNQANKVGIQLDGGTKNSVGINATVNTTSAIQTSSGKNFFILPLAISPNSVHLGQIVSGPGIAAGSTIAAINTAMTVTTVTLTKAMTADSSTRGIRFASSGRNVVQYNTDGIVLSGGTNGVASTDVGRNTFDGIRIEATCGLRSQTIGITTKANSLSNSIYGNGQYGVNVKGVTPQTVQGNNLGVKGRNQLDNYVINLVPQTPPNRRRGGVDLGGNYHAARQ